MFFQSNQFADRPRTSTPKSYVDEALSHSVDESSLSGSCSADELKLDEQDSIIFNSTSTSPKTITEIAIKSYEDDVVDKTILFRIFRDKDFNKDNLTNINRITLITQAVNDNHINTKAYVNQFDNDNERPRRDLGLDFYDESSDLIKT